jgi:hypothetical protein
LGRLVRLRVDSDVCSACFALHFIIPAAGLDCCLLTSGLETSDCAVFSPLPSVQKEASHPAPPSAAAAPGLPAAVAQTVRYALARRLK